MPSAVPARVASDPAQLLLFPGKVWPDLFGRALLLRHWGRIGTHGRRRLNLHTDPGAALNALSRIARSKRQRGYQPR